jgi:hypothetical protein
VAEGWADTHRSCGYGFTFETAATMPDSVAAKTPLSVKWDEIVGNVPNAFDAVSSPIGDLLVVLATNELATFAVKAGKLVLPGTRRPFGGGSSLLSEPSENPVLIEWAPEKDLERWTTTLSPLSTKDAGNSKR